MPPERTRRTTNQVAADRFDSTLFALMRRAKAHYERDSEHRADWLVIYDTIKGLRPRVRRMMAEKDVIDTADGRPWTAT